MLETLAKHRKYAHFSKCHLQECRERGESGERGDRGERGAERSGVEDRRGYEKRGVEKSGGMECSRERPDRQRSVGVETGG